MLQFIVNPNARSGYGGKIWAKVEQELKKQNIEYEVYKTKYQRHGTELVKGITADGYRHTLVVLGGDGTLNEVINGIDDYSQITLGYIPIGSSNDFARYFEISTDPKEALRTVLHPKKYRYMNIGIVSNLEKNKKFAVSCGMGFDADICRVSLVSHMKCFLNKIGIGRLTYVGLALRQLVIAKPAKLTVTLDLNKTYQFEKALFATAMNHPYEGGGCRFCPQADPCDDKMDVIVVDNLPKWKVLLLLPTAFIGQHVHFKGIHIYSCNEVAIGSEKTLSVHTDGETVTSQKQIYVKLSQQKVRVIAG